MKEIIVKIPDEHSELATQLLYQLGAEIEIKKTAPKKLTIGKFEIEKKIVIKKKKKPEKVSPTYLFGKWKDFEIDANKIREESWDRSHKYL